MLGRARSALSCKCIMYICLGRVRSALSCKCIMYICLGRVRSVLSCKCIMYIFIGFRGLVLEGLPFLSKIPDSLSYELIFENKNQGPWHDDAFVQKRPIL